MFSDSPELFNNVTSTRTDKQVMLPCSAAPGTEIVWRYQKYCFDFEHGTHQICSRRTDISRKSYDDGMEIVGDDSTLSISTVSTKMAGVYTCEERNGHRLYSRIRLNVYSEYSVLNTDFLYAKFVT